MDSIQLTINQLLQYGLKHHLITEEDLDYFANRLIHLLQCDYFVEIEVKEELAISDILSHLLNYAVEQKIIENHVIYKDLFDTEIMNCLTPRPSEVTVAFQKEYQKSPKLATDYFYNLSRATNYIRLDRIQKNKVWKTDTAYGELDLTINLSKPEKDPTAIALSQSMPKSTYPNCLLCKENVGYYGHVNHPGRGNHRIIPVALNNENWYLQYSPYVYYNEHCIVLKGKHEPMKISRETFVRLMDFVSQFPHYFIGSNADLPIVGGSILDHDHFQGGNYSFPMARASVIEQFIIKDVEVGIVKWPMSVLRLRSDSKEKIIELSHHILEAWRQYSDESVGIISHTGGESHNTITPIARFEANKFEMDLVLRNNRTTKEHPLGLFHAHEEHHHLKKENIGLIEVMGLAVLPARLDTELKTVINCMVNDIEINTIETVEKHHEWANRVKNKHIDLNKQSIDGIILNEVGLTFNEILKQCGVFKQNEMGIKAFIRFVKLISK